MCLDFGLGEAESNRADDAFGVRIRRGLEYRAAQCQMLAKVTRPSGAAACRIAVAEPIEQK